MLTETKPPERKRIIPILETELPGPTRKRTPAPYLYGLTYRNPNPFASGCVMVWEVRGGRIPYQIVIERDDTGEMHCHCTCADAIYRDDIPGHVCKHIQGFLQLGRQQSSAA